MAGDAERGERGEKLMVSGDAVRLRVWEGEPAGEVAPEHVNDYEYLAYVVAGRMRVRIAGTTRELAAGDSYRVPARTPYAFEVVEGATVVEAVTGQPSGQREFTAEEAAGAVEDHDDRKAP